MVKLAADLVDLLLSVYGRFSSNITAGLNPTTINLPQNAADTQISHLLYKCLAKTMGWVWVKNRGRTPADESLVSIS